MPLASMVSEATTEERTSQPFLSACILGPCLGSAVARVAHSVASECEFASPSAVDASAALSYCSFHTDVGRLLEEMGNLVQQLA
jgi:hypothetical protein